MLLVKSKSLNASPTICVTSILFGKKVDTSFAKPLSSSIIAFSFPISLNQIYMNGF